MIVNVIWFCRREINKIRFSIHKKVSSPYNRSLYFLILTEEILFNKGSRNFINSYNHNGIFLQLCL